MDHVDRFLRGENAWWQRPRFPGVGRSHLEHREITGSGHGGHTRAARQDQARSRIRGDLGQARRRVGGVQRKQSGTGSRDGQHGHDHVRAAGNADADDITSPHPFCEQPVGPPATLPLQVGVGQLPVTRDGGCVTAHEGVCRGEQVVEAHRGNLRLRRGGAHRSQRVEFPGQQHVES